MPAAAAGTDQPPAPIDNRRLGTVALSLFSGIGLNLVAAFPAPYDEANANGDRALPFLR
jgi:hypothetical protein